MAELLTIRSAEEGVEGWNDGAALVKDEATGQHYVVSTVQMPWQEGPETLVYQTDATGSPDSVPGVDDRLAAGKEPAWVAGGLKMSHEDAFADLSARIDDDKLITAEEFDQVVADAKDADYDDFLKWAASQMAAAQAG